MSDSCLNEDSLGWARRVLFDVLAYEALLFEDASSAATKLKLIAKQVSLESANLSARLGRQQFAALLLAGLWWPQRGSRPEMR